MKQFNGRHERGNVLFLILIAVALFAALSYAVTQSSRSGGDSGRETNILNAAQLTQYPTLIRTAVLRMVIGGMQDDQILFTTNPASVVNATREVFDPIGGGAIFQNAPVEVMNPDGVNTGGTWNYNMSFEIDGLGSTGGTGLTGNELIAFLPDVRDAVCSRINEEAGIIANASVANPLMATNLYNATATAAHINYNIDFDSAIGTNSADLADGAVGSAALLGQPFGCFRNPTTVMNVFYTVLLER